MQIHVLVMEMTNQTNTGLVDLLYDTSNEQNIQIFGDHHAGISVSAMLFPIY